MLIKKWKYQAEKGIVLASEVSAVELAAYYDMMETWSQIVYDNVVLR